MEKFRWHKQRPMNALRLRTRLLSGQNRFGRVRMADPIAAAGHCVGRTHRPGSPSASHLAAARASATPATMCSSSDCKAGRSNFACVKKAEPLGCHATAICHRRSQSLRNSEIVPVLLSHCAQGNGSYADKRPNGRESCTRHKRVPSPADASACRSYSASFSTPRYRGESGGRLSASRAVHIRTP